MEHLHSWGISRALSWNQKRWSPLNFVDAALQPAVGRRPSEHVKVGEPVSIGYFRPLSNLKSGEKYVTLGVFGHPGTPKTSTEFDPKCPQRPPFSNRTFSNRDS